MKRIRTEWLNVGDEYPSPDIPPSDPGDPDVGRAEALACARSGLGLVIRRGGLISALPSWRVDGSRPGTAAERRVMELLIVTAPPAYDSFGALLRAHRHRSLLSQQELAARSGLSERTIRNLEANRVRVPRASTARLLAEALELDGPDRETFISTWRRNPDLQRKRIEALSAPSSRPGAAAG